MYRRKERLGSQSEEHYPLNFASYSAAFPFSPPEKEDEEEWKIQNNEYSVPQGFSYLFLLLFFLLQVFSFIVFICNTTNRDVVPLWYSAIIWPIASIVIGVLFVVTSYYHVMKFYKYAFSNDQTDENLKEESMMFFYPRYLWDFTSAMVSIGIYLLISIIFLICIVSVLGVSPHHSIEYELPDEDEAPFFDMDLMKYTTLHSILVMFTFLIITNTLDIMFVYMGKVYKVQSEETFETKLKNKNLKLVKMEVKTNTENS